MAALVQSFPQQSTSTVTMIQTRPSSASGILQSSAQNQNHHQYPSGPSGMHRNSYHGINGTGPTTYRGQTSMTPVAPYAFTSTPSLSGSGGRMQSGSPYLRSDQRTASAPTTPQAPGSVNRSRYPAPASTSTSSTSSSSASDVSGGNHLSGTRDDSAVAAPAWTPQRVPRPNSTVITSITTDAQTKLSANSPTTSAKPSPDRYRRPVQRQNTGPPSPQLPSPTGSTLPAGSGMASVGQLNNQSAATAMGTGYQFGGQIAQIPPMKPVGTFNANLALRAAVNDMHVQRQPPTREEASRYRHRSIHKADLGDSTNAQLKSFSQQVNFPHGTLRASSAGGPQNNVDPLRSSPVSSRPASSPGRSASSEQVASHYSTLRPSATKREPAVLTATANPAQSSTVGVEIPTFKHDQPQLVNIPPRGSSDAAKRITNPSPLSKPMTMSPESTVSKDSFASTVSAALQIPTKATYAQVASGARPASPAARQLAALTEKGDKKSKASRLRRAFSFGSAAELRRAGVPHSPTNDVSTIDAAADRSRLRKDRYQNEREAEQARIAQKQEEGGIGQGIYSGQGNFYSGSTDNLSISSTASSASIMIRKMGQGMKKSTRSLVGLFRPKSVVGVPAAESAATLPSQAQVSMITVEAERERTNINLDPHDQAGGGTGFPKLERNSIDAAANATAVGLEPSPVLDKGVDRKSIVGGERERAEVLAAVKKGILKRSGIDSGNSSPVVRPSDSKTPNFQLPPIPHVNDSPISSAPSTPNDESQGHKRTGSVTIGGEDYFMSALRFRGDTKSAPGTPQGTLKRNATFSPRIQFHDTWPSGEYDRRGEIATCNRLTPMLAQQIKEELNSFKMEMEVHENSKIYTHFF